MPAQDLTSEAAVGCPDGARCDAGRDRRGIFRWPAACLHRPGVVTKRWSAACPHEIARVIPSRRSGIRAREFCFQRVLFSMAKILVTGAAGFIGFHTATRLLERGDTVVGVDSLSDY